MVHFDDEVLLELFAFQIGFYPDHDAFIGLVEEGEQADLEILANMGEHLELIALGLSKGNIGLSEKGLELEELELEDRDIQELGEDV